MKLESSFPKSIAGAVLAAALILPGVAAAQALCPLPGQTGNCTVQTAPFQPLDPATQPKFQRDLPVPIYYVPDTTTFPGFDYYEVQMSPVTQVPVAFPQPPAGSPAQPAGTQWLGIVNPATGAPLYTKVWGYSQTNNAPGYALNGLSTYPSMSFKATKGRPTKVKWINNAPDTHLVCPNPLDSNSPCGIDRTLMGTTLDMNLDGQFSGPNEVVNPFGGPMQPDNAMVIHLHGGEIPPDSDGMAELWIGNGTTAQAYGPGGQYYSGSYNVIDQAGANTGILADIVPHFFPPAGSGIPANYAALNHDGGVAGRYASGQLMRPTGNSIMYNYPNVQDSATIWYHDHALGKTRINVIAGPAGFYVVKTPGVDVLPTDTLFASGALPPEGDCSVAGTLAGNCYDVPIAFQDRSFNTDGSITFPNLLGQPNAGVAGWNPLTPGDLPDIHPQWLPEYFGDTPVVNGVAWPKMRVEPRPYRFRLLGGSNARCWNVQLRAVLGFTAPPMYVIANEQGYLNAPAAVNRLTICPGERYEVVVDFTNFKGKQIYVTNNAGAPFPNGETPQMQGAFKYLANVMRFDVTKALNTNVPAGAYVAAGKTLNTIAPLVATAGIPARELILNEVTDPSGIPVRVQIDGKSFEAPVTETPKRGAVEVWKIINTTVDAHPIHLHLVKFQVVNRQKFDSRNFSIAAGIDGLFAGGSIDKTVAVAPYLLGNVRTPAAYESGWKDTVVSYPGEVTTVIAEWDGRWADCPNGATTNFDAATGLGGTCKFPAAPGAPYFEPVTAGPYVWHCHIVDHEDNEMMRPSLVMP